MSIEIEGVGYSVETRLIGKEDLLLDEYGNGVERSYEDVNGVSHKITPISSSTIPLPADIRASLPGSTNISDGMRSVLSKIADLSGGITSQGIMESDTTVVLTGTLSHAEKKTLIEQQYTNLGGKTLTFEFQESFDISTSLFFEFKGFYNGTLIIDLNAVTISDSADAGQLFHIHDCSCKVEIKNGTINHSLSLYGIKAENCPAIYLNGIAFFGQDGDSNYAFYGLGVNGVISNCTYTEDNEVLLSDIGGASYNAYTDAKVIAGVIEHNQNNDAHALVINAHNQNNDAHALVINAHNTSETAHQALFDAKAPAVHSHAESEAAAAAAAAASAVSEHNADEEAHALKAPLASPTFTGVPAVPTAASGTNTTQIASTAFVANATNFPKVTEFFVANPGTVENQSTTVTYKLWYRRWSDGWLEQGCFMNIIDINDVLGTSCKMNFLLPFVAGSMVANAAAANGSRSGTSSTEYGNSRIEEYTNTSIKLKLFRKGYFGWSIMGLELVE